VVTITDSVLAPKKGAEVSYSGRKMVVSKDCKAVYLAGTETLAGSCCSMLTAFNNLIRVRGFVCLFVCCVVVLLCCCVVVLLCCWGFGGGPSKGYSW